jgi:hypothetical protein
MKSASHGKGGDTVASKCKQVVFLKTLALAPFLPPNFYFKPPNFVYLYSANYTDCYYVNPLSTNALPLSIVWH